MNRQWVMLIAGGVLIGFGLDLSLLHGLAFIAGLGLFIEGWDQ